MGERTVLPLYVRIAYGVWYLVFAGVVVACSILVLVTPVDNADVYDTTVANWRKDVIVDVTVQQDASGACEPGYTDDFVEVWWGGAPDGACYCPSTDSVETQKSSGGAQCTCQGGVKIAKTQPQVLRAWSVSQKAVRVCVKRLAGYSFAARAPLESGKCRDPDTEKGCGQPNQNSFFCVPVASKCPITALRQGTGGESVAANEPLYVLRVGEQSQAPPVVEARGSVQGAGVCIDAHKHTAGECERANIDPQYFASGISASAASVYAANGVIDEVPTQTGHVLEIYQRRHIFLEVRCRTRALALLDRLPYSAKDGGSGDGGGGGGMAAIQGAQIAQTVLCTIFSVFVLFAEVYFTCVQVQARCIAKCCRNSFAAFKYALWAGTVAAASVSLARYVALKDFLAYVLQNECVNDFTKSVFQDLYDMLSVREQATIVAFLGLYLLLDWQFLLFLRYVYRKTCYRAGRTQGQNDDESAENKFVRKGDRAEDSKIVQLVATQGSYDIQKHDRVGDDVL